MNITGLIFIIVTHFLTGRGILALFKVKEKILPVICLSFIIGVVVFSMIPMVLEMVHVPITSTTVVIAISTITIITFAAGAYKLDYSIFRETPKFTIRLYELVYICVFIGLMIPSIWRCFYYPPNARDVLTGPEPIAEYTVKEHTMINSVLTLNLSGTNNHLKPPFISGLQIIYKLLVHPFGQLWLSIMVLSFMVWLYYLLRSRIHPVIAGLIMLFFISMPDPYSYTYIILFDYSNMIVFFTAAYYLSKFAGTSDLRTLYFSSFLFGLATIIRLETVVFAGMFIPLIVFILYNYKMKRSHIGLHVILFMFIPFAFYYIWVGVFLTYYMPGGFNISDQVTHSWGNVGVIFTRISEINSELLFSDRAMYLYGYIHFIFLLLLIADCIFIRRFNKEAMCMLYAIAVVYLGMPLMAYITPLFDLSNTTKRGLYKIFPLMAMYMANSGVLIRISKKIRGFEFSVPDDEPVQPLKVVRSNPPKRK